MQKILAGVWLAMAVGMGVLWWQMDRASDRAAEALRQTGVAMASAEQTKQALDEQQKQAGALLNRLAGIEKAVSGLKAAQADNDQQLGDALDRLKTLPKTEGDTDAQMDCLDSPVPAALDSWLRGNVSAPARADRQ